MTATKGLAGFSKTPPRNLISFSMRNPATPGKDLRHALGGGVRAVRRAERVVDVHVPERRQLAGERRVVLLLLGVEADVFQEHDVARPSWPSPRLPPAGPTQSGARVDLASQQLGEPRGDRREAVLLVRLLRPAEMAHEDERGALLVEDVASASEARR